MKTCKYLITLYLYGYTKYSGNKFQILREVRCNWLHSNMFFLLHFVPENTFKIYSRVSLLQYSCKNVQAIENSISIFL